MYNALQTHGLADTDNMSDVPVKQKNMHTRNAMLDLFIGHQKHLAISNALAMSVLGLVLWRDFSDKYILIWLACGYVMSIARVFIFPWIERNIAVEKQFLYRKRTALFIAAINGFIWGSAAWLFLDIQQVEAFVIVIGVMYGAGAVAVSTHASYSPTMWSFLATSQGMLMLSLATKGHISLFVLTVIFTLTLVSVARTLESIIEKSITIDFRNEELLQEAVVARESAERASQAKSRFLSTASHDLRQPLHAIMLLINLLKMKVGKRDEVEKIADNMEISTDAMMALFNNILDISRLDAGLSQPHIIATDLSAIINTLLLQFRPIAERKGLLLGLDESCVNQSLPLIVMADKIYLERCLNNIVSNAIKFTDAGEVVISVSPLDNKTLQISISDTGRGIAESDFGKIFQEFTQISFEERTHGQGLGLGLSIVDRLTKLMHIKLCVSSTVGKGTCFIVDIEKAPVGMTPAITQDLVPQELTFSGVKILLVDDDDAVRENMSALIKSWGCEVFVAATLLEAVVAAEQAGYIDAILMDYGLRDGVNGLDVIQHLYSTVLKHQPPALIITGDTSSMLMETLGKSGIAYIHKPAKPITIRNFLQRNCLVRTSM